MSAQRTPRARLFALLTCLALALLLLVPAAAAAGLKDQVKAALSRHGMGGSGTSVAVYDLTAKRSVFVLRPDVLRLPASNEKLVTSAAALALWSDDYHFSTKLYIDDDGVWSDGVIRGDIYLRGCGDATLSTASFHKQYFSGIKHSDIQGFVKRLKAMGVTYVKGRVIADERYFDTQRRVSNWRSTMTAYCGPLSALTLNASYASNGKYVTNPALTTANVLTKQLKKAGIPVKYVPKRGATPAGAILVRTGYSAPLSQVLAKMNKPSDNFIAEMLLKGLGAGFGDGGTTADGATVAQRFLKSANITGGYRIRDGSGLSYQDRLSARAVVKLLNTMARRTDAKVFRDSLPVAGKSGTLKTRMRGTAAAGNVRAKTGTLKDASCLSGYVTTANGHKLTFSILMNGTSISVARAHAAQNSVAVVLARARP